MRVYCQNGVVVAWHEDTQNVPASAYGEGVYIIMLDGGFPSLGEPAPEMNLDETKASLKAAIDVAAEAERLKYITPGAGQSMTYQEKLAELVRYEADTNPLKADYPMMSAEIGITAGSLTAVAATIRGAYDLWKQIGGAIEIARLQAKANIDKAATEQAARVAANVAWPSPSA